jgi:hypothetical protein
LDYEEELTNESEYPPKIKKAAAFDVAQWNAEHRPERTDAMIDLWLTADSYLLKRLMIRFSLKKFLCLIQASSNRRIDRPVPLWPLQLRVFNHRFEFSFKFRYFFSHALIQRPYFHVSDLGNLLHQFTHLMGGFAEPLGVQFVIQRDNRTDVHSRNSFTSAEQDAKQSRLLVGQS